MAKKPATAPLSELRIIAGQYRGRKIQFRDAEGLRPTGDRIRETLFSWLQGFIPGARCLDLFAGSGALGFEAASRGAKSVTMVEFNAITAKMLISQKEALKADNVEVLNGDALTILRGPQEPFQLIFLDPPFHGDWLDKILSVLGAQKLLQVNGYCYLELEREKDWPNLPNGWEWHRQKEAGQVKYGLARNTKA